MVQLLLDERAAVSDQSPRTHCTLLHAKSLEPPKSPALDVTLSQHMQPLWRQAGQQQVMHHCLEQGAQSNQQPLIIYCGVKKPTRDPQAAQKCLHFQSHVHFARWLFKQRRGAVTPWAILITSWREAKPCAIAIAAARTGCCNGLRLDDRRPPLRNCLGAIEPEQLANVAVSCMIVMLSDGQCTPKAANWVHHKATGITKLPTHAACDDGLDLRDILSSMPQLIQCEEMHPVKQMDLVEPQSGSVEVCSEFPAQEQHAQLAYTSPQMEPAYAVPEVVHASIMCFKALPEPMHIELNPWLDSSTIICP